VNNKIADEGKLKLHSLNSLYEPYELEINEVKEIWKFVNYISSDMPDKNMEKDELVSEMKALRQEVRAIQMKLNL
jgi:hypothetical protein